MMILRRALISTIMCLFFVNLTRCQRRIVKGERVQEDKPYVVYLVKREESRQAYNAWLCGGAIVTPLFILTSAACVEDVVFMYAVAGYTKYVPADKLNSDPCTREKKKKVVYVCLPKAYTFAYPEVEKWSNVDIALAKVESPYDFNDESYLEMCSYTPNQIEINYDRKYQQPGIDGLVLGWGHKEKWRDTADPKDYNSPELLYGPVRIQDKEACKEQYTGIYEQLHPIIDRYMICTFSHGNIDSRGEVINKTLDLSECCGEDYDDMNRRNFGGNETKNTSKLASRRFGICQNDHGGPLVTWVGSHEKVIGVASVFRIDSSTSECIGPYLFTSTFCSASFLHCIITGDEGGEDSPTRRRELCDKPLKEQGLTLKERVVSWQAHPDGPADNEKIQLRPQLPLHSVAEYRRDKKHH